ncbi:[NiFe]-hydrogenase assembly chaperone HybE [Acidithiobacillus sp. M4-SHS-6]|uniref:[NiFe]-hydrogenase assembly chaperone HybE n=1 Tax=Acidithiobacillus sp. M4-SHS-6 TaxID=3383024 RepID=UPI0039BE316A
MNWQIGTDRDNMAQTLEEVFAGWHQQCFANSPNAHPGLSVEIRDLQKAQDWYLAYLLTPIALYRLAIPRKAPDVPLPEGWSAAARVDQPCTGLGPALSLKIPDVLGQGHLQYLPEIGHFLWQPLVQNLRRYPDAAAVFAAWEGVIDHRRKIRTSMQEQQRCDRRDFLRRLMPTPREP